jgi:beta-ureidopropionase / N-carbamoyl-L-amino-acid hydrolase
MTTATRNVPESLAANRYVRFGGAVGFGWLSNDFGPDGHIGDPTTATAERGGAVRGCRRRVLRGARRGGPLRAAGALTWTRTTDMPTRPTDMASHRRIDAALLAVSTSLGEIGRIDGPNGEWGNARLALTDADRDGRDLVVSWMRDLGLDVRVDAIGNVVATRPGTDPVAGAGDDRLAHRHRRHRRTLRRQPGGARGPRGRRDAGTSRCRHERPLQVAFFTDEEGARFAPDMLGSLVFVGGMPLEEALDIVAADDGARLGDELERIGYAGAVPCPTAACAPRLRRAAHRTGPGPRGRGVTIGVVEGVQGISWTEVVIVGQSAHAGTTPMRLRHDPAYCAAAIATFVRDLTRRLGPDQVGTVGRIDVYPNLVNVVPARVVMTVDLRNTDDADAARRRVATGDVPRRTGRGEGVTITTTSLARFEPVDVRPGDGRSRRADADARPLDPADAERRRPRRPDARSDLPDGDDLHPERERAQPQHRRVHRGRRHRGGCERAAAGASSICSSVVPDVAPAFDLVTIDSPTPMRSPGSGRWRSGSTRSNARTSTAGSCWPTATACGVSASSAARHPWPVRCTSIWSCDPADFDR